MSPLAIGLALLIGVTLGLLGGGGSILTVPVFVYALGYDPKLAIAMSLPVVGITALIGAGRHWAQGNVDLRVALPFGAAAMVGAFVGARVSHILAGPTQLVALAIVMLAAAVSMLRNSTLPERERPGALPLLLLIGLGVGVLTGIIGIGGGFLLVPALVLLGGVPMRRAVGTSLLVIVMNTTAGFLGHRGSVVVPWDVVLGFAAVAAAGILAGAALIRYVPQQHLKRGFAVLLVGIAALILWQNRAIL